eukprot:scaffold91995_cov17-Tisochrysis_lutea.AAC.1
MHFASSSHMKSFESSITVCRGCCRLVEEEEDEEDLDEESLDAQLADLDSGFDNNDSPMENMLATMQRMGMVLPSSWSAVPPACVLL